MIIEHVQSGELPELSKEEKVRSIILYQDPFIKGITAEDIEKLQISVLTVCPETPEDPFRRHPNVVIHIRLVLSENGLLKFNGEKLGCIKGALPYVGGVEG